MAETDQEAHGIRKVRHYWLGKPHLPDGKAESFLPVLHTGRWICNGNERIFILDRPVPKMMRDTYHVDVVIISSGPKVTMGEVVRVFHPRRVVIDATNSRYRTLKWLREAEELKVPCHAVTINGAYVKEF